LSKHSKEARVSAPTSRKVAREARGKPWYGNSNPAAKAADDLRRDVARMAAELAQAVQPVLGRKQGAAKQPKTRKSLQVDVLQHVHPSRVAESMDLLEESIRSINAIGRGCCSPFTGVLADASASTPVHVITHTPLATENSASVTSSDYRDYLTVIFALAAAEEYSHGRQLLQYHRKGESKRIFGRTEFANAEGGGLSHVGL
jgi:hypothetical protein